ncbi:DUF4232 domain-containing protein [Streptomyces himalayensis]|nr:DUF4232 domain-containing protein [Streptomyces himalayensis]
MGLRAQTVTLTNCGKQPYSLNGYPSVRVLDENGKAMDGVKAVQGTDSIPHGPAGGRGTGAADPGARRVGADEPGLAQWSPGRHVSADRARGGRRSRHRTCGGPARHRARGRTRHHGLAHG